MTTADSLRLFGLCPSDTELETIRRLLKREAELESSGSGAEREEDLALLCCVQLFARAQPEDILLIWSAKRSGMDLGGAIDVQLLCGMGLEETKRFLVSSEAPRSDEAYRYILECEESGDFKDFSRDEHLDHYRAYFEVL